MNLTATSRAKAGARHIAVPGLLLTPRETWRRGLLTCAALFLAATAPLVASAGPDRPTVCWKTSGDHHFVEVSGLDRATLDRMNAPEFDAARWDALLRVAVRLREGPGADRPSMLGSHRIEDGLVLFRPRFPLEPGLTYEALFDPSKLPGGVEARPPIVVPLTLEAPSTTPTTSLVRVDPASGTLPENLLKFYLTFSAPMSRGQAYDRVHLLDASGRPIDAPFLELGEELWDPSATRLTLLFDPGRIKTGLKPRDEAGPVLEAGKSYTLVVDEAWPDARGNPLLRAHRKPFRVGPDDHISPDPASWTIQAPRAGSRDPLILTLTEPLDRALLGRLVTVLDPEGRAPPGRIEIGADELRWSFLPSADWREGEHRIVAGRDLEDLAGNSIGRPFEVDTFRVDRPKERAEPVTLRFRVHAGAGK